MNTKFKWKNILKNDSAGIAVLIVLLVFVLSLTVQGFFTLYNFDSILRTTAITAAMGLAQLMALCIGHFNLAIGAMGCISAMFCAYFMEMLGVPVYLAVAVGLLIGFLVGALQGILIVATGINPFVITLSLSSILYGGTTAFMRGAIFNHLPESFTAIGKNSITYIPLLLLIAIVMATILFVLIHYTPFGRKLLATGANPRSANFAGIDTKTIIVIAHAASGLLAGFSGMMQASRLASAQISLGTDWMMLSFAAPVLGGTILSGGKASVFGTLLGALLMTLITNGLVLADVSYYWYQAFLGVIIIGSFAFDRMRMRYITQLKF